VFLFFMAGEGFVVVDWGYRFVRLNGISGWVAEARCCFFDFAFEDPFKGDTTRGGVGEGASVCVWFFL
jgi:hypothetical protein